METNAIPDVRFASKCFSNLSSVKNIRHLTLDKWKYTRYWSQQASGTSSIFDMKKLSLNYSTTAFLSLKTNTAAFKSHNIYFYF